MYIWSLSPRILSWLIRQLACKITINDLCLIFYLTLFPFKSVYDVIFMYVSEIHVLVVFYLLVNKRK